MSSGNGKSVAATPREDGGSPYSLDAVTFMIEAATSVSMVIAWELMAHTKSAAKQEELFISRNVE
jgi:hypothetical protein